MGEKSKTEPANVEEKHTSWVPVTPEKLFDAKPQPDCAERAYKSRVHSQVDSTLQGLNDQTSLLRDGDVEPMQILQHRYQEKNKQDMGTCTLNLHQGEPGKTILGSDSPEISTPSKKCNAKKRVNDKSHGVPKKKKHRPKVVVEGMPKRTPKSVTRRRDTSNRDTPNKRKYTRKNKLSDGESVCKKAKRALHFDTVQECTSNNNETSTLETKTDKVMVEKTTGGACDLVAHLKNGMRVYKRLFPCLTQSRRLGPNFPNICKKRRFSRRKKATTFIPWWSVATEDSHHCYTLRNRKVSTKVSSLIKAKVRDSIIGGESSMCLVSLCNAMVKIKKKVRSHKFIRRQDMASLAAIPNCNQSPLTTFKTAAVVNTESLPQPIKPVPIVSTESLPPPVKPAPIVSIESLPSPVNSAPIMNAKSPLPPANKILTGERQGFHTPPETLDNLIHPGKCKKRVEKRQTKRGLSLVNVGSSYSKSEAPSLTLVSENEESSLALVNQTLSSQRQGVGILHGLHSLDAIVPTNNKKRVSKKQSKMRPSAGCSPPETIFLTANLRDPLEWLKVFDSILQRLQGLHISNEDNEIGTIVPYEGPFDPKKKRKLSAKVNLDAETLRVWNLLMVKDGREGVDNMSNEDTNKWWENERKVFTGRVDSFIARMHLIQGNRRFSAWKGSVVDSVVGVFLTQNVSDHLSSSAFMSLAAKFPIQSTSSHDACTEDGKLPNNQELDKPNMVVEEQADDGKTEVCMNHETENKAETLNKASRAVAYDEDSNTDKRDPTKKAKDPHEQLCSSNMDVKGEKFATRKKGETEEKKETTVDWDNLRKLYLGGQRQRSSDTTDSVDWEAVRRAQLDEVANTIRQRGQHFIIAGRIKDFLDRVVADHESIDLEWLRNVPPDDAKEFLLSICGLGLKSVECIRLLSLQHIAFPVDTNVGRIAVRLGWVPLQPLPEELQIHLLQEYPLMDSIQKYLWPRLYKLDQRTLYELHYQMITFGKVFCTKRRPNCNPCPMRGECRHFASAFASAKLALPGPREKSEVTSIVPVAVGNTHVNVLQPIISFLEANPYSKSGYQTSNCEPIIEEPTSPEPQYEDIPDIEDFYGDDSDEIPTLKLNLESFTTNLLGYMDQYGMSVQEGDFTKALVALNHEAASIPRPKLKSVGRLRTQHQVYELPDSHPILTELQLERRDPDDPCPYLLSIWLPGETANSMEPPKQRCNSQGSGDLCNEQNCFSCNSTREQNSQTTRGTILIPCRTATRGRFPLNGTYFQVNEVFSDHESSLHPINVPTALIWNLPRRTLYCGTSATTIFREIVMDEIQQCFWKGYICVRGFERKTRAPRPLGRRFHASGMRKAKNEKDDD